MKITSRHREGVTILEPKGKIDFARGEVALREAVQEVVNMGSRKILIDFSGVTMMDSSGLGELVSTYTTVIGRGGKFKLLSLPAQIADILQETQLISVFEVFNDEDEAIASF